MPCKSFCRPTSPLSQSFHREILPPFLILSLLISFAKPFWLWMYSSIYTDWQWLSKRTLTLLPLNLLESAVIQWSVRLNSLWLYCSLFLIWVSLPYPYFLPIFYSLLSIPHRSWTSSSKLAENTPWKKLLFDNWLCWWVDGKAYALLYCWGKNHHPSSMGPHETPPQNTEVDRPLISTHPVVRDNKQQHGNIQRRTVLDNKTINH